MVYGTCKFHTETDRNAVNRGQTQQTLTLTPTSWPFHRPRYTRPKDPWPISVPNSKPSNGPVAGNAAGLVIW